MKSLVILLSGWGQSEVERHHQEVNQGHRVTELKSDQPFPFSLLSLIKHVCVYTAVDSKYDVSSTNVIIEHIHCNIVVRQRSCINGTDLCSCAHTQGHIHASTYIQNVVPQRKQTLYILLPVRILSKSGHFLWASASSVVRKEMIAPELQCYQD